MARGHGTLQLLVALTALTATSGSAQIAPAASEDTGSKNGWARVEEGNDSGEETAGITAEPLPRITITASRDTIYGGLEDMRFVLKRDKVGEALTVKLWLHQDEDWLNRQTQTRYVYFYPQDTTAVLRVHRSQFDPAVARWGCILAKVIEVNGQDYSKRRVRAGVWVISSPDPLVKLFVGRRVFTEAEDAGQLSGTHVVAVMADGLPRGVSLRAGISARGNGSQPGLSATPGEDYDPGIRAARIEESSFQLYDDTWVGGGDFVVPILDDNLREGDETFEILLQADPELAGLVTYEKVSDWTRCDPECAHLVNITDDEGMPSMALSVSEDEIMEEGETSSTAMVSIADGVRFGDEKMVTLALGGTATRGADYAVSPPDADRGMADYQVVLPARAASAAVTIRAMSDEVDDPGEKIEVSAALDGTAIGSMQAIRIMNREIALPKITAAANRADIIAGIEDLELTLTREGPLDESLRVTVQLAQDQQWIAFTSCPVTFAAGQATATATLRHSQFSSSVVESGQLTAAVQAIDGYDVHDAEVTVDIVSQEGPAIRVFFEQDAYRFGEDDEDATAVLVAEAAHGMPRGATVAFSLFSESGTAIAGEDFQGVSRQMTLREEDFSFQNGSWQVRRRMPVTLLDDDIREGDETCDLVLQSVRDGQGDLALKAVTPVDITDDEDIPALDLRLSADRIEEKGETSSTATVSIANGKHFATDQMVTFEIGGSATPGVDYKVSPADADRSASGHQVVLAAGSASAGVRLAARNDDLFDPGEKIEIAASLDGDEIGSGVVDLVDGTRGPALKVTFEGIGPPRGDGTAGTATGPFKTRFTFSEPVEGFTKDDIDWSTLAWTTHDSTVIGLILSDFTELRPGLEYSVMGMPTKSGQLHVGAGDGAAYSAATGAPSEWGSTGLWIDLPPNAVMVWPRSLTVREEDTAGGHFAVVLSSEPTGPVSVDLAGTDGTALRTESRLPLTFSTSTWSVAYGVAITAVADANTANETVSLTLVASGGGYDGKSASVLVTVEDNGGAGSGDVAGDMGGDAADIFLLADVTPEDAVSALFGEKDLGEDRLSALDRLGNHNGDYDLGDALSWMERCRRGAAVCGAPLDHDPNTVPAAAAALGVNGVSGRDRGRQRDSGSGGHVPARRDARGRTRGHKRRRWGVARFGFALLLAATMTGACADDVVQPSGESEPGRGHLTVWLSGPAGVRDTGAMLVVSGPGIDAVQSSSPGSEVFGSGTYSSMKIIVAGALSDGPVLEVEVPDRALEREYRVQLLEVAGEDYSLREISAYSVEIRR